MMNLLKRLSKKERTSNNIYDLSICCIIKDENKYLNEWINYHLKVGVQHFYIYDNGSKVPISDTLEHIGLSAYATVTVISGKARQVKAYGDCIKRFGKTSRWIGFIDVDEFIVPKSTNGNLVEFLKDYEQFGGIGVNWLVFGSSGHIKKTGKQQLASFKLRAKECFPVNRHIKSIVQPRFVKSSSTAHSFSYVEGKFCVNENFMPIEHNFSDLSVDRIRLNHYFCRSLEEFEEKIHRGIADTRKGRTLEQFHYHDKDANEVEDNTINELFYDYQISNDDANGSRKVVNG